MSHNLAGVAQSHGYRVALAQSKLVPLKRAEDVLTMANGPSERGTVDARQNPWFGFGHAHHRLTLGPVTGRLLAEMITGKTPFVDPRPYRADRF